MRDAVVLMLGTTLVLMGEPVYKKYAVEYGTIHYTIDTVEKDENLSQVTKGERTVKFIDFGAKELVRENLTRIEYQNDKETGREVNNKANYYANGIIYSTDLDKKEIVRMKNPDTLDVATEDPVKTQEMLFKEMEGKKIGTDKVAGIECDLWDVSQVKQCVSQGLTLKTESDSPDGSTREIADKIDFKTPIDPKEFEMPPFPIYSAEGDSLDRSKLEAMDKEEIEREKHENDQLQQMMAVMAEAMKKAGVKEGEEPTPEQEAQMKEAMLQAMLPRMKEEILAQQKMTRFSRDCFAKASTLNDANSCTYQINEMTGEAEEDFTEWSPEIKEQILGELDLYLNTIIPCVDKAQTIEALQECLPVQEEEE